MKYYRKSHRYKRKKPIYRNRVFWFFLLLLIAVSGLCYFVFFTPTFKIKEIEVIGNEKVPGQAVEIIAWEEIRSKGNLFFKINADAIKEKILLDYPKISLAKVIMRLPDSLAVEIQERQAAAIWCKDSCFKIDKDGIIFENAEENVLEFLTVKDFVFQDEAQLGKKVVKENDLAWIININSYLEQDLSTPVKEFVISSPDKLIVLAKDGWEMYFNLQNDVNWQLTKLKVIFEERIPSGERNNLEYIELRFGNFANPKFKVISTP